MFVAVCALFACDPTHEKISNDGHITIDELKAKTTVTVDKAASGLNGNVISCQTLAPVNAKTVPCFQLLIRLNVRKSLIRL